MEKLMGSGKPTYTPGSVYDAYSDNELIVKNGKVVFSSPYPIVLLEKK